MDTHLLFSAESTAFRCTVLEKDSYQSAAEELENNDRTEDNKQKSHPSTRGRALDTFALSESSHQRKQSKRKPSLTLSPSSVLCPLVLPTSLSVRCHWAENGPSIGFMGPGTLTLTGHETRNPSPQMEKLSCFFNWYGILRCRLSKGWSDRSKPV